jgi:Enoyl-CoA hydratase/isomerase
MQFIRVETETEIAKVTLDHPNGNRINFAMREEFLQAFQRVADSKARVLVVSGKGTDFSLGGDVRDSFREALAGDRLELVLGRAPQKAKSALAEPGSAWSRNIGVSGNSLNFFGAFTNRLRLSQLALKSKPGATGVIHEPTLHQKTIRFCTKGQFSNSVFI